VQNPFGSVTFAHRFHATATVAWMALAVPSVLLWQHSIPWVVFMSVWANVVGHWSSYQATSSQLEARKQGNSDDDTG